MLQTFEMTSCWIIVPPVWKLASVPSSQLFSVTDGSFVERFGETLIFIAHFDVGRIRCCVSGIQYSAISPVSRDHLNQILDADWLLSGMEQFLQTGTACIPLFLDKAAAL